MLSQRILDLPFMAHESSLNAAPLASQNQVVRHQVSYPRQNFLILPLQQTGGQSIVTSSNVSALQETVLLQLGMPGISQQLLAGIRGPASAGEGPDRGASRIATSVRGASLHAADKSAKRMTSLLP